MKRFILTLVLILLTLSILYGEEDQKIYRKFSRALGFQYGAISGSGLSYFTMLRTISFRFSGGIIYAPEGDILLFNNILDYNIGINFEFDIFGVDFASWISSRLYFFTGVNHRGVIPVIEYDPENENMETVSVTGSYIPSVTVGAGIGMEAILFQHFSIPLELGYAVTWANLDRDFINQLAVNLQPQIGLRYRY